MEVALAWLQGLSSPLQILLIVILSLVFKDDIAAFVKKRLGYGETTPTGKGENLPERSSKEWFDDIAGMMTTLETNHLSHLQAKVDVVHENQANMFSILRDIAAVQRDTIELIKDIKEFGVVCRNK